MTTIRRFSEYGSRLHQKRGATIEEESIVAFRAFCKANGWSMTKANPKEDRLKHIDYWITKEDRLKHIDYWITKEDRLKHIDYWITKGEERLSVDIKGKKQFAEQGLVLVEIKNVNGDRGWLLGKADLVAFYMGEGNWVIVKRNDLYRHLQQVMGLSVMGGQKHPTVIVRGEKTDASPAIAPKWHQRADRQDMVTFVAASALPVYPMVID